VCATVRSASVFLLAQPESTALIGVLEGPQHSRHAGLPPFFMFVSALVFSLAPRPDPAITHYLLKYPLHPPVSLFVSSLSVFPSLCLSFSPSLALSLCLSLSVSLSLSLSLLVFCSLSVFPSPFFSHSSLAWHTLFTHRLLLMFLFLLVLSLSLCLFVLLCL